MGQFDTFELVSSAETPYETVSSLPSQLNMTAISEPVLVLPQLQLKEKYKAINNAFSGYLAFHPRSDSLKLFLHIATVPGTSTPWCYLTVNQ